MTNEQEERKGDGPIVKRKYTYLFSTMAAVSAAWFITFIWWSFATVKAVDVPPLSGALAKGQEVFKTAGCWYCHHPTLKGQRWGAGFGVPRSHAWWVAYLRKPRVMHAHATKQNYNSLLRQNAAGKWVLQKDAKHLIAYVRYLRELGMDSGTSSLRVKVRSSAPKALAHLSSIRGIRTDQMDASPTQRFSPSREGKALYSTYCSKCHGSEGRGNGPLAPHLSSSPRDLVQTSVYMCRSSQKEALTADVRRTIQRGTGGCAVVPLGHRLSPSQLVALTEHVRALARMRGSDSALVLRHARRVTPSRSATNERPFQDWLAHWWSKTYKEWLERNIPLPRGVTRKERNKNAFRNVSEWRTWIEWQSFNAWVRKKPERLQVTMTDWKAAVIQHSIMKSYVFRWKKSGQKEPFLKWLKKDRIPALTKSAAELYKREGLPIYKRMKWHKPWKWMVYRSNWMAKKVERKWKSFLGNLDRDAERSYHYLSLKSQYRKQKDGYYKYLYISWREREERRRFRQWKDQQNRLMYMAWRGEKIFKKHACPSCKSNDPKRPMTVLQALHRPKLRAQILRCGREPHDIYRSIALGVGAFKPGLTPRQMQLQFGDITNRSDRKWQGFRNVHRPSLWDLVAYVRFMSRDLPLLQALPRIPSK